MRRFLIAVPVVLILVAIAAAHAQAAIIYNNGVTVQSTNGITVTGTNSGSGSPDGNRLTLNNGTTPTDTAVIRFSFSGLGVTIGSSDDFRVVTDGWGKAWSATISAVNGTSVTSGTVSQTGSSSVQDFVIYLPANTSGLTQGAALTSIDITFSMTAFRGYILVDTVGTPEPATLILFGLGLVGVGSYSWTKRRRKQRSRVA